MQTPQAIRYGLAVRAFKKAYEEEFYGTDDVSLVERFGKKVKIIETNPENIKITYPIDLTIARNITKNSRIGFGQDSHRFVGEESDQKDKPLILGSILIENELGLDSNSDGDFILHALFNALSQAVGWLKQALEDGPIASRDIHKMAKENGISDATLRRAQEKLKIRPFKEGVACEGKWFWKLLDE